MPVAAVCHRTIKTSYNLEKMKVHVDLCALQMIGIAVCHAFGEDRLTRTSLLPRAVRNSNFALCVLQLIGPDMKARQLLFLVLAASETQSTVKKKNILGECW